MAVRDAVAGDLDALDVLADVMVTTLWRCDDNASARPSRAQLAAWISGDHGLHVYVTDTTGVIDGAMVHQGPLGKWWIIELKIGVIARVAALCTAVWNANGACYGYVANANARARFAGDSRFTFTGSLCRFHP